MIGDIPAVEKTRHAPGMFFRTFAGEYTYAILNGTFAIFKSGPAGVLGMYVFLRDHNTSHCGT